MEATKSKIIKRGDVVMYLVDCLGYSREEAEQMTSEQSFADYLTHTQVEEMQAFLAI